MESKLIDGFNNKYYIFNNGDVYSVYSKRFVKPKVNKKGYILFGLIENGKQRTVFQHRLIAKAWIPNPDNKPQINHINSDKKDNRIENLEWCTNGENQLHSYKNGKIAAYKNKFGKDHNQSKKILIYKDGGGFEFDSLTQASVYLGVSIQAVSMCLKGVNKTCKGYKVTNN